MGGFVTQRAGMHTHKIHPLPRLRMLGSTAGSGRQRGTCPTSASIVSCREAQDTRMVRHSSAQGCGRSSTAVRVCLLAFPCLAALPQTAARRTPPRRQPSIACPSWLAAEQ